MLELMPLFLFLGVGLVLLAGYPVSLSLAGTALAFAFGALLDRALAWLPRGGDLYVASKHHRAGLHGKPSQRVLVRLHRAAASDDALARPTAAPAPADLALEVLLAELVLRAEGGRLTMDRTDPGESVIVVDLPAPG